jgi:hypothetical protein
MYLCQYGGLRAEVVTHIKGGDHYTVIFCLHIYAFIPWRLQAQIVSLWLE